MSATFDAIGYARKLEAAGFTREQAEIQAECVRESREAQSAALEVFVKELDEKAKRELVTKGDIRELELRLQKEIKSVEYRLLLWQFGIGIALAAIMAKGFGWIGF